MLATGISADNSWQAFTLDPYANLTCGTGRLANETHLRSLQTGDEFKLTGCAGDFYAQIGWLPNGRLVVRRSQLLGLRV